MKRGRSSDDSESGGPPDEKHQAKQYITSKGKGRAPDPRQAPTPQPEPEPVASGATVENVPYYARVRDVLFSVPEESATMEVSNSAVECANIARLEKAVAKFQAEQANAKAGVALVKAGLAINTSKMAVDVAGSSVRFENLILCANLLADMIHEFDVHNPVVPVPAPNFVDGIAEVLDQAILDGLVEVPPEVFKFGGEESVGDLPERLGEPLLQPEGGSPMQPPVLPDGGQGSPPESALGDPDHV